MLGTLNSGPEGAHVTATDLAAGYGAEPVLRDVTLDLLPGTLTAICGPNGSGKSTLLRTVARQQRAAAGVVLVDERDLASYAPRELARNLSFLPQQPLTPAGVTAGEVVQQGRFPHRSLLGGPRPEDREAVDWALDVTRTADLAGRDVAELSGGERQRVWVALALAQRSRVLLLDEPTTFLDIRYQLDVLHLLRRLTDELGLTVAVVLHDLNQAAATADRMVLVSGGGLAAVGRPADVLTADHIEAVFGVRVTLLEDPETGRPLCIPRPAAGPT